MSKEIPSNHLFDEDAIFTATNCTNLYKEELIDSQPDERSHRPQSSTTDATTTRDLPPIATERADFQPIKYAYIEHHGLVEDAFVVPFGDFPVVNEVWHPDEFGVDADTRYLD